MSKPGCVYIMANVRRGTTYIGVTSDLVGRVWQHRTGALSGFSKRYGTKRLVYFEIRNYPLNTRPRMIRRL